MKPWRMLDAGEELTFELATPNDIEAMMDKGELSRSLHIASFIHSNRQPRIPKGARQ